MEEKDFSNGLAGSLINALLTIILIWVAWGQLDSINNTSSADFLIKFKHDFFTKDARKLIHLIEKDYIDFIEDSEERFFKVKEGEIKNSDLDDDLKKELLEKKAYSAYQVDDFLLGHFEDVGIFEQKGALDIEMVYEEFSWYLETAWENCAIKKYINKSREEDGEDIYDKFEYINDKCKSFGKVKLGKESILLWKIRYWFVEKLKVR